MYGQSRKASEGAARTGPLDGGSVSQLHQAGLQDGLCGPFYKSI